MSQRCTVAYRECTGSADIQTFHLDQLITQTMTPANSKPYMIFQWQSYSHQARTVQQSCPPQGWKALMDLSRSYQGQKYSKRDAALEHRPVNPCQPQARETDRKSSELYLIVIMVPIFYTFLYKMFTFLLWKRYCWFTTLSTDIHQHCCWAARI